MTETPGGTGVTVVDEARVERVLEALSLASVGAFEEAIALSGALSEDRFGALEESLLVLLRELKQTREEHDKAMSDLEASRQDLEVQLQTIERQRIAIRELSVPIIDVWDDVITLPLVGAIDSARASEMTEKLLHRMLSAPVLMGDYVVVGDLEGHLHWLNRSDGELAARSKLGDAGFGDGLVVVDGVLYAQNRDGSVGAFRLGQ